MFAELSSSTGSCARQIRALRTGWPSGRTHYANNDVCVHIKGRCDTNHGRQRHEKYRNVLPKSIEMEDGLPVD